eukprot:747948-Hanusia_phi.AAC.2
MHTPELQEPPPPTLQRYPPPMEMGLMARNQETERPTECNGAAREKEGEGRGSRRRMGKEGKEEDIELVGKAVSEQEWIRGGDPGTRNSSPLHIRQPALCDLMMPDSDEGCMDGVEAGTAALAAIEVNGALFSSNSMDFCIDCVSAERIRAELLDTEAFYESSAHEMQTDGFLHRPHSDSASYTPAQRQLSSTSASSPLAGPGFQFARNADGRVVINSILAGGSADCDGTIQIGDEIVAVDGFDCSQLSARQVTFRLRRPWQLFPLEVNLPRWLNSDSCSTKACKRSCLLLSPLCPTTAPPPQPSAQNPLASHLPGHSPSGQRVLRDSLVDSELHYSGACFGSPRLKR